MNLTDLTTLYSTDERCRELLNRLRWPKGSRCSRCKRKAVKLETEKHLFYCKQCDYQFSVTTGTVFNDTHLPLEKWFLATLLLCEAKKGMSACQIQRTLGISYKTAWYLCHRIRAAMVESQKRKLKGVVEMDETYFGGRKRGVSMWEAKASKQIVLGIRQRGGELRFFQAKDVTSKTLSAFIKGNVSETVEMFVTDEFPSYSFAVKGKIARKHRQIRHKETYAVGNIHTNTIESAFSLFKRGVMGTWHKISVKHLPAYLQEMAFRFNRRNNEDIFLDTLRHMVTTPTLTFERLTQAEKSA
jgi:transposase-like protein